MMDPSPPATPTGGGNAQWTGPTPPPPRRHLYPPCGGPRAPTGKVGSPIAPGGFLAISSALHARRLL